VTILKFLLNFAILAPCLSQQGIYPNSFDMVQETAAMSSTSENFMFLAFTFIRYWIIGAEKCIQEIWLKFASKSARS